MSCDSKKDVPCVDECGRGCAIFVNRDSIGTGGELGRNLLKAALFVMSESEQPPRLVAFMNEGVRLTAGDDEDILETLKALEDGGTEILSCGTCLNFYELTDNLKVGTVSNMYDIMAALQSADKVVTL